MVEEIIKFIAEQILVLVPVLFVIGLLLKNTPKVPDWIIPWALLVIGIVLAVLLIGDLLQGIIQGVLVVGATVLAHQLVKQSMERQ
jgi:MFS superfamily sulfate permease-like transporter